MSDKIFRNYYKRLGILQSASEAQIKTAFKTKMRELHPDTNKDNQDYKPDEDRDRLQIILEGKDILLNPETRRQYDEEYNEEMRQRKIKEELKIYGATDENDLAKRKLSSERARQAPEFIKAQQSFNR